MAKEPEEPTAVLPDEISQIQEQLERIISETDASTEAVIALTGAIEALDTFKTEIKKS